MSSDERVTYRGERETLAPRLYRLDPTIQPYPWGTRGSQAFIPRLLGIPADAHPYAELWLGTHPKGPASVWLNEQRLPLPDLIRSSPRETVGAVGSLPFLFKVLSAAEPLSIQAHPNLTQARRLHARDPQHYPDANHKPELAIALDELVALAGFLPWEEIVARLDAYPELRQAVGTEAVDVRDLVTSLVRRSLQAPASLQAALDALARRVQAQPTSFIERLFLDLRRKYPGPDVGLVFIFLMNLVHLRHGEALYISPGMLHAYVRGNIVECMANSDNVVRAGLTGKFRDAAALLEILTYECVPVSPVPRETRGAETVYLTPTREFRVSLIALEPGQRWQAVQAAGPEIYLVTQGRVRSLADGLALPRGTAVFKPAVLTRVSWEAIRRAEVFRVRVPEARS